MNPRISIAIFLLVAGLAAGAAFFFLAPDADAPPPPRPTAAHQSPADRTCVYESPGGRPITARFDGEGVWLFLPEGTVQLPPVPAASGARFSDGAITLHTKGEEAILTRDGAPDRHLRNNPRLAVWESAKLDGMDFRAVGNEPGWILEIWSDRLVYRGDYGRDVVTFPRPEPHEDQATRTTTYTCRADGRTLLITLRGESCRDTMADDTYETTVILDIDGRTLRGCGQALH